MQLHLACKREGKEMDTMSHVTERVFASNSCTDALPFQYRLNLRRGNTAIIGSHRVASADYLEILHLYLKCRKIIFISVAWVRILRNFSKLSIFVIENMNV